MQAKCPYCFGEKPDCEECNGTGFIGASFAKGKLYTRHCTNPECGFDNGGKIVGEEVCSEEFLKTSPGSCVYCESKTEWLLVGEM